MMERLIPSFGVGARPLYGQDMNRAVSLRTGSGSVYDDAIAGGEHYVTPAVYSKGIYRGKVSDKDLATIQAPGKAAKNQELEGGAHDAEMFTREQLGRYQDMTRQVGPELTNLFNRLPAGEQAFILSKSPEERSATLKSHPLKSTSFPPAGNPAAKKATPTMFPTITPRGLGGIRPEASIDSLASEAPAAVDADYFEMAGAT
jgi:hypothetical protein